MTPLLQLRHDKLLGEQYGTIWNVYEIACVLRFQLT